MEVSTENLKFFRTPAELRRWFKANGKRKSELWIGMYRKESGKGGVDYKQALDEALCFGWIDGIRKKLDDSSFTVRFTPRKPTSIWSNVNIAHINRLTAEGRMMPEGIAAFEKRDPSRSGIYAFERAPAKLEPSMIKEFKKTPAAWKFFENGSPYYRQVATWWVISAKREETRRKRLAQLIASSAEKSRLQQFTSTPRSKT
jgi:uncharacterized protein YdeI (YjbR/CyaY-like superfamily)